MRQTHACLANGRGFDSWLRQVLLCFAAERWRWRQNLVVFSALRRSPALSPFNLPFWRLGSPANAADICEVRIPFSNSCCGQKCSVFLVASCDNEGTTPCT